MLLNIEILLESRKLVFCRQPLIAYRILESSQTNSRLSDKRIAEYAALPRQIVALAKQYPAQDKLLRKIAARYTFGQCIEEILQKYNMQDDGEIYKKIYSIVLNLQKEGIFLFSTLGLQRWLKLKWFLHYIS